VILAFYLKSTAGYSTLPELWQELLGHRSGRITTHYSQVELTNLIEAADKVFDAESRNHVVATEVRLAA